MEYDIYTIGHSNHSLETFLEMVQAHSIRAIADVRSLPYSRMNPQFNKESLEHALRHIGIAYRFFGTELGARPRDRETYVNGRVSYRLVAETDSFQLGIQRVVNAGKKSRVAMMCAEADPLTCHRSILISRVMAQQGIRIAHIRSEKMIETHEAAQMRLLEDYGLNPNGTQMRLGFQAVDDLLEEAYLLREQRIAYVSSDRIGATDGD